MGLPECQPPLTSLGKYASLGHVFYRKKTPASCLCFSSTLWIHHSEYRLSQLRYSALLDTNIPNLGGVALILKISQYRET